MDRDGILLTPASTAAAGISECEMRRRERVAFSAGAWFSFKGGVEGRPIEAAAARLCFSNSVDQRQYVIDAEAKRRYPVPKVKRRRTVKIDGDRLPSNRHPNTVTEPLYLRVREDGTLGYRYCDAGGGPYDGFHSVADAMRVRVAAIIEDFHVIVIEGGKLLTEPDEWVDASE